MDREKEQRVGNKIDKLNLQLTPVLVSACLLGIRCRYDRGHNRTEDVIEIVKEIRFIPICPEQLGGLPTPRAPANIIDGDGKDVLNGNARVISITGEDVTGAFIEGAKESLKLAILSGAKKAILKRRSPSCGLSTPYCETNSGYGPGVTAALFTRHDIEIIEAG